METEEKNTTDSFVGYKTLSFCFLNKCSSIPLSLSLSVCSNILASQNCTRKVNKVPVINKYLRTPDWYQPVEDHRIYIQSSSFPRGESCRGAFGDTFFGIGSPELCEAKILSHRPGRSIDSLYNERSFAHVTIAGTCAAKHAPMDHYVAGLVNNSRLTRLRCGKLTKKKR